MCESEGVSRSLLGMELLGLVLSFLVLSCPNILPVKAEWSLEGARQFFGSFV